MITNLYIFFRFQIINFTTGNKILDFISLMGNNVISTTIAVEEKYTYFISEHYKLIGKI